VLPCVDVFVADEFCVWATILRTCLALRWVPNLRTCGRALHLRCGHALGRPTCGRALHCVGAPNLRTCLALRLGAQLADVPCVAFGCPSCGRAFRCVGAPSALLPCVDIFVADRFFIWAPILQTCRALRLGARLADAPFVALWHPTLVRPY
jgi:hypothetical protein